MNDVPPPSPPQDVLSPDGRWRWDGTQWVANQPAPPPPPKPYPSPPVGRPTQADAGPVPGWAPPPMAPGAQPGGPRAAPAYPVGAPSLPVGPAAGTRGLAYQFSGDAMWSILFGIAAIAVPLFTPIYFPILPIFGVWRGVRAVTRGRVAGGVIGLIVSGLGCLSSLLYSGLLNGLLH